MKSWMICLLGLVLSGCSINPAILMEEVRPNVVLLNPTTTNRSGATGFEVIAPSGNVYTLTNEHVCHMAGTDNLTLIAHNGKRKVYLRILEVSDTADLCLLEALPGADGLHVARYDDHLSSLFIFGHPHLNPLSFSTGIELYRQDFNILDPEIAPDLCPGTVVTFNSIFGEMKVCTIKRDGINLSATIYPGNSGSPVLNNDKEVVGVVFAGDSSSNQGVMVPLDVVQDFLINY